jgi:RimJ/RimL family protein N-acetyltransferase
VAAPAPVVRLREVLDEDLPALVAKEPPSEESFAGHWRKLRADPKVVARTILADGRVAGSLVKFEMEGRPLVAYWVGREFWGRGIGTAALRAFLGVVTQRPLWAQVATDNEPSVRVLERCGFRRVRVERGFAAARGCEVDEHLLVLDGPPRGES